MQCKGMVKKACSARLVSLSSLIPRRAREDSTEFPVLWPVLSSGSERGEGGGDTLRIDMAIYRLNQARG